jgi:hypothetical protein
MASKQQILAKIQEMDGLEEEVKSAIVMELSSYPDEMSNDDIMRFDGFVASIEQEEMESAQIIQDVVDASEHAEDLAQMVTEQATEQMLKTMQVGLQDAQAVVAQ